MILRLGLFTLVLATAASAEPLRYASAPGDTWTMAGSFESETTVRKGASVERLAFTRAGRQRVLVCSGEGNRRLYAIEAVFEAARATAWVVDGKDRRAASEAHLASVLPAAESTLDLFELDDRGRGAPVPLDAVLPEAILRVLDEIEVLPEGDETAWNREGRVGAVQWKGEFHRDGDAISATFSLAVDPAGGARVVLESVGSSARLRAGRLQEVEGHAVWTVVTAEGSERREMRYRLEGRPGSALAAPDIVDASADAAPLAAAAEAWRMGERDRALELWTAAGGDVKNRWADHARARAGAVRAEHPVLGTAPPEWLPARWIGTAPPSGGWRLVYAWASWMPRCPEELAGLAKLLKGRERVHGIAFTRVDTLQTEDDVRRVSARGDGQLAIGLDEGKADVAFKVADIPRVWLLDPDGRIRYSGRGHEIETLRAVLDRLAPE